MTRASSPSKAVDYFQQSQRPFTSLIFLLPFLVLYELGTFYFASDPAAHTELRIIAFKMMQDFFRFFGASGKYLPALAVVGILLTWHIARNDPWRIRKSALFGMAVESIILGFPVMVLSLLAAHHLPLAAA